MVRSKKLFIRSNNLQSSTPVPIMGTLSMLELVEPRDIYRDSYEQAVQDMVALGEEPVETAPVPFTQYWLVDGKRYLGLLQLRHQVSGKYKGLESHIHYSIAPKERGKGYGTTILKLGLEKAKELGLQDIIITSKETNIGSRKIIEANGGKLIDTVTVQGEREPITILKYSFDLHS